MGLKAQKRLARLALMRLWATGCSVYPKPVHTTASAAIMPHSLPVWGRRGVSNINEAMRANKPRKPTSSTPRVKLSALWLVRSMVMMPTAYRKADKMAMHSPAPR